MKKDTTLVFLPPGGGDTAAWGGPIERFAKHHPVIAIDMPGAGTKVGQKPLATIPECAAYVEGILEGQGIKKPVLMGFCMGGLISQWLALRNSEAYEGVVLVATAARIKIHEEILSALLEDPDRARKVLDRFSSNRDKTNAPPYRPEVQHAYLKATNEYDARELVQNIKAPTLIIHGDKDLATPLPWGEYVHQKIPGSRFKLIPGATHMLPKEFPAEVEEAAEKFFAQLPD